MKWTHPFLELSQSDRKVHSAIWLIGLVLINIPDWKVTLGPFHSDDFSLLIPSFYGLFLNALLFYGCAEEFKLADLGRISGPVKASILIFLKFSVLESILDSCYYALHYWTIDQSIIVEILWGQLLMNFIFFYLPAVMYGIIKAWQRNDSEAPVEQKIIIKDGVKHIHLSPSNLTHVESDGNYVTYHADKKHLVRQSLAQAEAMLPDYFARSHKSFIVNTRLIERHTYNELIVGGFIVPIGRKYRKDLQAILNS